MVNLDNADIIYKSTIEAIEYFTQDPKEVIAMLKLNGRFCPASIAISKMLAKSGQFGTKQSFYELRDKNYCTKAITLLPRIFDWHTPKFVARINQICMDGRGLICQLEGVAPYDPKKVVYAKVDRLKAIRVLKGKFEPDAQVLMQRPSFREASARRQTLSERFDAMLYDRKVDNGHLYGAAYEIGESEDEDRTSIIINKENFVALNELETKVIDRYAFSYRGVFISPSIMRGDGENPSLIQTDELRLRNTFEDELKKAEQRG